MTAWLLQRSQSSEYLTLEDAHVPNVGWEHFKSYPLLKNFWFDCTQVNGVGFECFNEPLLASVTLPPGLGEAHRLQLASLNGLRSGGSS